MAAQCQCETFGGEALADLAWRMRERDWLARLAEASESDTEPLSHSTRNVKPGERIYRPRLNAQFLLIIHTTQHQFHTAFKDASDIQDSNFYRHQTTSTSQLDHQTRPTTSHDQEHPSQTLQSQWALSRPAF